MSLLFLTQGFSYATVGGNFHTYLCLETASWQQVSQSSGCLDALLDVLILRCQYLLFTCRWLSQPLSTRACAGSVSVCDSLFLLRSWADRRVRLLLVAEPGRVSDTYKEPNKNALFIKVIVNHLKLNTANGKNIFPQRLFSNTEYDNWIYYHIFSFNFADLNDTKI